MTASPTAGKQWPQRTRQPKRCRLLPLILAGAVCLSLGCRKADSAPPRPTPQAVGFRIFQWNYQADDGSSRPLTVAAWYPARSTDKPVTYANGFPGAAFADADADTSGGPYPLIVWSHGYTGSGLAAAYLGEYLVPRGYVLAAVDHNDPATPMRITGNTRRPGDGTALRRKRALDDLLAERPGLDHTRHAYRPTELSLTIDHLLTENADPDSPLHGLIDPQRLGAGGHSMGGYTVMSLVGCLEGRRDRRIRAAVLHSPAAWMWRKADYERIAVPVVLMIGELEKRRPVKLLDIERAVAHMPSPSWYLEIIDAAHATFVDRPGAPDDAASDDTPFPTAITTIARYTRALFDSALRDSADAKKTLSAPDANIGRFVTK